MITITRAEARDYLVGQLGLRQPVGRGATGVRRCLAALRCVQLDPLDRVGTNADLVALARVDDIRRGDVYRHLLPGHAFEHFAKERCLLPPSAFAAYRDQAAETPWWRLTSRLERLDPALIEAVLEQVRARGPLAPSELGDFGRVRAIDWSGWKGTARAGTMALEVLWTRCQIVVCGRRRAEKVYDIPDRALPDAASGDGPPDFATWALRERVEAAGLLATADGPWWSMLRDARRAGVAAPLLTSGELVEVQVEGSARRYLAPADLRRRTYAPDDGRMRVLGPLDPLLWNRPLVKNIFDFDYVWEVYKPAASRRWGYYVCPLLHRGALVGRFEGHTDEEGRVVVDQLWREPGHRFDDAAFAAALEGLAR